MTSSNDGIVHHPPEGGDGKQGLIAIVDIARNHGVRPQTIHKIVKRLRINSVKVSSKSARGQKASHVTVDDSREIEQYLAQSGREEEARHDSRGVFYLVLLEPELDPGRFKAGFSSDLDERMRSHKTVAPMLRIVKTWPCKPLWGRTAIDCVTCGCERIYTEVFRTENIQEIVDRTDQFFALMPRLTDG